MVAAIVELECMRCYQQKGYERICIAQELTQIGERMAEVGAGDWFWLVEPQQAGQLAAVMRTLIFGGYISQEGAGFVRHKSGDGLAVYVSVESTQQG
jgi:hypothetical protein